MAHTEQSRTDPPQDRGAPADGRSPERRPSRGRDITVALVLTVPWAGWALVRALGLEAGFPWVPAIAFTPYIALSALLPLALAGYLRRWWPFTVLCAVVLVFAALLVPRAVAAPGGAAADGEQLTVLTANLYEGRGDPEVIAALVEAEGVDVLVLQEITPEAAAALDELGVTRALPHDVADTRPGTAGSAIHSRHPATDVTPAHVTDTHRFARQSASVDVPGAPPVEITSAHPVPPVAPSGIDRWTYEMASLPEADDGGPLRIIAGDFNATLDHAALRDLLASGYVDAAAETGNGLEPTWPNGRPSPPLTIDHVLIDRTASADATSIHDVPGSDHRAVLATLTLPAG